MILVYDVIKSVQKFHVFILIYGATTLQQVRLGYRNE